MCFGFRSLSNFNNQPAEQPIIGGPPTVCANDTVTIEVTSGNIFNNTDWYWYTDTNAAPIDTGLTHQVVSNVNVTFYVRGEGVCANGPFATYTVTVTPKPNIYISGFVSNATDCGANDGQIILLVDSGGTAPFDFYLYNVGGWYADSNNTGEFTSLYADHYHAIASHSSGCKSALGFQAYSVAQDSVVFTATLIGNDTVPYGEGSAIQFTMAGGTPPYTILYSDNSFEV